MKETRKFEIKNKIFTKKDILNIGEIFLNEYKSAQKAGDHSSIMFKINCVDDTSYESESINLFDNGGILDTKKIDLLEITFHNYMAEKYINISVVSGGYYRNNLLVRGDDENWVRGIFTKLKEIIDSIKPQDNFIIRHKTAVLHVIAFGVGIFLRFLLLSILDINSGYTKYPSETVKIIASFLVAHSYLMFPLDWFTSWVMGISWAPLIRSWLLNFWPSIEFDFGPEHLKVEKLRRIRITMVFSIVIIPIVLEIAYDLVKYFLK